MQTLYYEVDSDGVVIPIGRVGENEVTQIVFDVSSYIETYGSGTVELVHRRKRDSVGYVCENVTLADEAVTWVVTSDDTGYLGQGKLQVRWYVDDALKKSAVFNTMTGASVTSSGSAPQEVQDALELILDYVNNNCISTDELDTAVATYFDENPLLITTDTTLSVSGEPADAKVTGDLITELDGYALSAYPEATVSGSSVSFADGANDVPVKEMIADINPVQDLSNGDPTPDNICPISGSTGMTITVTDGDSTTNTYTVSWSDTAGTVYGGTLNLTTGELIVNYRTMDMGDLSYTYSSSSGYFYANVGSKVYGNFNIICSCYKTTEATAVADMANLEIKGHATTTRICIKDSNYTTASGFKASVTGQTICYEMSPVTYTLTSQEINTLLGANIISSDTGDVDVTYRADPTLYIGEVETEADSTYVHADDADYVKMLAEYMSVRASSHNYQTDLNSESQWVQGKIVESTGEDINTGVLYNYRIRTSDYIPSDTEKIIATNGYVMIYIYSASGTFESVTDFVKEYSDIDSTKKYRVVFTPSVSTPYPRTVTPSTDWEYIFFLKEPLSSYSPYKRAIAWGGNYPSEWYIGKGSDYSLFSRTTTYAEMITAWDTLMASSNNYITKATLGTSSDNQTMYAYTLTPTYYRNLTINDTNRPPTIFINASMHGLEKSAAYGTYYFVRDLVENWYGDPLLEAIRSRCKLVIVPVANPWGFNNFQRKNANGVDINRNWADADGTDAGGSTDPTSIYYAGESPLDQPETQILKALIDSIKDEVFFALDFHTRGGYKAPSWEDQNWLIVSPEMRTDPYYVHAYYALNAHISSITENLLHEYSLDSDGAKLGHITIGSSSAPNFCAYFEKIHVMGHTFEGHNGFYSESDPYSDDEQKSNSELLGNYLKILLATFAQVE